MATYRLFGFILADLGLRGWGLGDCRKWVYNGYDSDIPDEVRRFTTSRLVACGALGEPQQGVVLGFRVAAQTFQTKPDF